MRPSLKREEARDKIKMLRTWRLIDELDLTDEQSARFFPIMKEFDRRQEELNHGRRRIINELVDVLREEKPSEKKLQEKIAAIRKNGAQLRKNREDFFDKAAKILSLKQQAQLILFQERFERNLKDIIRDIRGHMSMGPVPEKGPPEMWMHPEHWAQEYRERLQKQMERLQGQMERFRKQMERFQRDWRRWQKEIEQEIEKKS